MKQGTQNKPGNAEMASVGFKLFFLLADKWGLTQDQQCRLLGINSRTTLQGYRTKSACGEPIRTSHDLLERLSLIAGIRKGVELLYTKDRYDDYMRTPNKALAGQTPLDRMLAGNMDDLYAVRRYLDASRGTYFA